MLACADTELQTGELIVRKTHTNTLIDRDMTFYWGERDITLFS